MTGKTIQVSEMANRYGTAIFSLAQEEGKLDAVAKDLNGFLESYHSNSDLKTFADSQAISSKDKLTAITALVKKAKMTDISGNFLRLVASKGRFQSVEEIITGFNQLVLQAQNEIEADITVSKELTADQSKALSASLNEKFNKSVDMNIVVDPAILGGIIIKVGSKMIDNSLRTKLDNLKIAMKEVG